MLSKFGHSATATASTCKRQKTVFLPSTITHTSDLIATLAFTPRPSKSTGIQFIGSAASTIKFGEIPPLVCNMLTGHMPGCIHARMHTHTHRQTDGSTHRRTTQEHNISATLLVASRGAEKTDKTLLLLAIAVRRGYLSLSGSARNGMTTLQ